MGSSLLENFWLLAKQRTTEPSEKPLKPFQPKRNRYNLIVFQSTISGAADGGADCAELLQCWVIGVATSP